ncbi:hypothetical protein K505DRAFT_358599 [Melanomma pulvis-pyrius CBS 109.77]|uniref:MYND-type domain-containing protein n=1 Tax=Melanomma pulvis-pyrius CBS 109.77 TaxID=1314802 RepID=A0A6A6XLG8_9PLEO|nr:hypothetical protein K505DRAFT_358599 [Melanomma pulvis-pyrius CBS 109.77]
MAAGIPSFLNPALCANTERVIDGRISPCQNSATNYCSQECQRAHWKLHKPTCKSPDLKESFQPEWIIKNYIPAFIGGPPLNPFGNTEYFWGNVPALDLLNVKDNEGDKDIINRDLSLLFAASGDIRNVVKSIVGIPEGYQGQCTVVINDINFSIVARNAIMLLTTLHFQPEVAVPMIVHLWYSVLLPASMLQALQDSILPYIDDVCTKIKDKAGDSLQAKTFSFGDRSLRLVLTKVEWDKLRHFFKVPNGITSAKAQTIRREVTMASSRVDYVDRALYGLPPGLRKCKRMFRNDGIVLPYGSSRRSFDTPNPTFFQQGLSWPMNDDADPMDGWFYKEIIKHLPAAKNDMLGGLFFFLRNLLLGFCNRVQSCKVAFRLFAIDGRKLPSYFKTEQGPILFDRIEVSNICDRGYVGPATVLQSFGPLLKPKSQNPKATLLMLFINAVREVERCKKRASNEEQLRQAMEYMDMGKLVANEVLEGGAANMNMLKPEIVRIASTIGMFGDFDGFFTKFLSEVSMPTLARASGVRIKKSQTIINPWPFRVTDTTTKEEFQQMCNDSTTGHERYMEFEKAG